VVATLDSVQSHDWKTFFEERVYKVAPGAPLGGIRQGGWNLSPTNELPSRIRAWNAGEKELDLTYSIGLQLGEDGAIKEVSRDSAADKAGVVAGGQILGVNGRTFSTRTIRSALRATRERSMELLVEQSDHLHSDTLDYTGGERYPTLSRDSSGPDLLGDIVSPRTKEPKP